MLAPSFKPRSRKEIPVVCANPQMYSDDLVYPCGQCAVCRNLVRKKWTARILLEARGHVDSSFVTATYADAYLPLDSEDEPVLSKDDVQKFLKRLRKAIEPRKVRYFVAGEYGTQGGRPHYHFLLFGLGPADYRTIAKAWGMGHVHMGHVTASSARYCAAYTTKKSIGSPRVNPNEPEFALMSRKPALGVYEIPKLAEVYRTDAGSIILTQGDIELKIRIDGLVLPLDRHLSQLLRDELDIPTDQQLRPFDRVMVYDEAAHAAGRARDAQLKDRLKREGKL